MNKVYISGTIADVPLFNQPEDGAAHLAFQISVRHRTTKGAVKRELYRVNAWNHAALWGRANLRLGQNLAVQGYLTQRIAETGIVCVEVTAEEFILGTVLTQGGRGGEAKHTPSDVRVASVPDAGAMTADIAS